MTLTQLRRQIKKNVDAIPSARLSSLADYVAFLARPELKLRIAKAERALSSKKGTRWRSVRDDV